MDDLISRAAAIKAADSIIERDTSGNNDVVKAMTAWKKFIEGLPPAQPSVSKTEIVGDVISRQALLDAVDGVDWYHQNKNGEMVHGANSDEHQAWYKAEDIYKAIKSVPSAQPKIAENLYLYKCFITDKDGLQHEVIHTGDIRRVTGWKI